MGSMKNVLANPVPMKATSTDSGGGGGGIDGRERVARRQPPSPAVAAVQAAAVPKNSVGVGVGASGLWSAFVPPGSARRRGGIGGRGSSDGKSSANPPPHAAVSRAGSSSELLRKGSTGRSMPEGVPGGIVGRRSEPDRSSNDHSSAATRNRLLDCRGRSNDVSAAASNSGVGSAGSSGREQPPPALSTKKAILRHRREQEIPPPPRGIGQEFREGELECDCQYSRRFSLNHRLSANYVLNSLDRVTLDSFRVAGRSELYVYPDKERNVFYMTLSEVRGGGSCRGGEVKIVWRGVAGLM